GVAAALDLALARRRRNPFLPCRRIGEARDPLEPGAASGGDPVERGSQDNDRLRRRRGFAGWGRWPAIDSTGAPTPGATVAFRRRPKSGAYRPFIGSTAKGRSGSRPCRNVSADASEVG